MFSTLKRLGYRLFIPLFYFALVGSIGLKLLSHGNAASISVSTNLGGLSQPINPDLLGFNGDNSANNWTDPRLLSAAKGLQPENLRGFPGGTGSNFFNWETGKYFITAANHDFITPDLPTIPDNLSIFANAAKAAGSRPVFDINVMTYCPTDTAHPTSTDHAGANCTEQQACGPNPAAYTAECDNTDTSWGLPFQLRMLKTAQSMGLDVKYVELGNELYNGDTNYTYYFPSVQTYINKVNAWIPAIKQAFPGVKVGVVGFSATACQTINRQAVTATREDSWNAAIYQGVRGEDAVAFHTYYRPNITTNGSVRNAADTAALLSSAAQNCLSSIQNTVLSTLPSGLGAWFTEWNLSPANNVLVSGSWAHGLTQANFALGLLRQPQIQIADSHNFVGDQAWGAIFQAGGQYVTQHDTTGIAVPTNPPPLTQPFGKTAIGFSFTTLLRSLRGADSTQQLRFSAAPAIAGTTVNGLNGQAFSVGGKRNLFFSNASDQQVVLDLSGLPATYSMLQYASAPDTFVTGDASIAAVTSTVSPQVILPPYSTTSLLAIGPAQAMPTPPSAPTTAPPKTKPTTVTTQSSHSQQSGGGQLNSEQQVLNAHPSTQSSNPVVRTLARSYFLHPLATICMVVSLLVLTILAYAYGWTGKVHNILRAFYYRFGDRHHIDRFPPPPPPTIIYPTI